jgi:cytidine deaminase
VGSRRKVATFKEKTYCLYLQGRVQAGYEVGSSYKTDDQYLVTGVNVEGLREGIFKEGRAGCKGQRMKIL